MYRHLSIVKRLTIPYVPLVSGSLGLAGFEPAIVVSDIYFQTPKVIGTTKTLVPLSTIAVSTITVNLRLTSSATALQLVYGESLPPFSEKIRCAYNQL